MATSTEAVVGVMTELVLQELLDVELDFNEDDEFVERSTASTKAVAAEFVAAVETVIMTDDGTPSPHAIESAKGCTKRLCRSMVSCRVCHERTKTILICSNIRPLNTDRAVLVRSKGSARVI